MVFLFISPFCFCSHLPGLVVDLRLFAFPYMITNYIVTTPQLPIATPIWPSVDAEWSFLATDFPIIEPSIILPRLPSRARKKTRVVQTFILRPPTPVYFGFDVADSVFPLHLFLVDSSLNGCNGSWTNSDDVDAVCDMASLALSNFLIVALCSSVTASFFLLQRYFYRGGVRALCLWGLYFFSSTLLLLWYSIFRPSRGGLARAERPWRDATVTYVRVTFILIEVSILAMLVALVWTSAMYVYSSVATSLRAYHELRVITMELCRHFIVTSSLNGNNGSATNTDDIKGDKGEKGQPRRSNLNNRGTGGGSKVKGGPLPPLPAKTSEAGGGGPVEKPEKTLEELLAYPDVWHAEPKKATIYALASDTYLGDHTNNIRHQAITSLAYICSFMHAVVHFVFVFRHSRIYSVVEVALYALLSCLSGLITVLQCLVDVLQLGFFAIPLGILTASKRMVECYFECSVYWFPDGEHVIDKIMGQVEQYIDAASAWCTICVPGMVKIIMVVTFLPIILLISTCTNVLALLTRYTSLTRQEVDEIESMLHAAIESYRDEINALIRTFNVTYQDARVNCVVQAQATHGVFSTEKWEYIYGGEAIVQDEGHLNLVALNGFIMAAECEYDAKMYLKLSEQHFGSTCNLQTYKTLMWTCARCMNDKEYLDKYMVPTCIKFMNDNQFKIYQGIHVVGKKECILSI